MKYLFFLMLIFSISNAEFNVKPGDSFLGKNNCSLIEYSEKSFEFKKGCITVKDRNIGKLECSNIEKKFVCIDSENRKNYILYFDFNLRNKFIVIDSIYIEFVELEYESN